MAGLTINAALIEQFRGRNVITVFIATLGASLIIQNLLMIIYGAANVSYSFTQGNLHHVGPFLWTTSDIEVIVSALVIAGLLYLLLQRSKFGKAIRAVSQDRVLAQISGIPARRIVMQTWGLAGALAGFAGFALADTVGTFGPGLGFSFLLLTITAAVAGGIGRPYATLGGALVVGMAVEMVGDYTSSAYQLVWLRAAGRSHAVAAERAVRPPRHGGGASMMYWVSVVTESAIFAILALGLDMVWGWGGDFDLAFYGYLALGSYMTMVLTIGKPVPPVSYIIGWRLPYPLALLLAWSPWSRSPP